MIPVGYRTKIVALPEPWLGNAAVQEILSVSECFSESPIDEQSSFGRCNEWWFFETREALEEAIRQARLPADAVLRRFFYEVHERSILDGRWHELGKLPRCTSDRKPEFRWRGYDVTCFTGPHGGPECSPLSCNSEAERFQVNEHCLLPTLPQAIEAAEAIDRDGKCEPGPYGIMSVWEVDS